MTYWETWVAGSTYSTWHSFFNPHSSGCRRMKHTSLRHFQPSYDSEILISMNFVNILFYIIVFLKLTLKICSCLTKKISTNVYEEYLNLCLRKQGKMSNLTCIDNSLQVVPLMEVMTIADYNWKTKLFKLKEYSKQKWRSDTMNL